ncbi:hypothetical protein Tco_0962575 [Tanacetum coccineum]
MAISVILVSSDSSEDNTDTTVIPIETPIITPTIPPSPDYTPASPDYSPASDSESNPSEDPSSDHIPQLPTILPFLSSADKTTDSDTQDTPPSPTYDFHSDASSDSSSRHSLPDHSSPDLPSTYAGPSRKRRRSPRTSVLALPLVSRALSPAHTALIPSPKRGSDEPHLEQDIDLEIQAEIDECFAYADALKDRGIDARVVVEAVDREESETGVRSPVEVRVERVTHLAMLEDIPEPAQEGAVEVTYETLGDLVQRFHDHTEAIPIQQGHRIGGVELAVTALTERIAELERDNRRLRMISHHLEISSSVTLLCCKKMPNTRSGASMTQEEVEELVTRRVAEEMEAREAAMNLEPLNENRDEQEGRNRGNGNRGNRGNGNGGNEGNGNGGNGGNGCKTYKFCFQF